MLMIYIFYEIRISIISMYSVQGIDRASQLFGYFLMNESSPEAFIKIACEKGGMKKIDAKDALESMKAYKRNNM